jgi:NAD(P)-dependent dehydrogenase (short-subunit alcohol dehydrogenase family)
MNKDTRSASADGYELTFAVNYLAHAQFVDDLLDSFATPARIVLLGSNTYHANLARKILRVQPSHWRDPIDLAQPATNDTRPSLKAAGVAYSNSKLAILYFAHELQRRASAGINVSVFEPGVMPGTDRPDRPVPPPSASAAQSNGCQASPLPPRPDPSWRQSP